LLFSVTAFNDIDGSNDAFLIRGIKAKNCELGYLSRDLMAFASFLEPFIMASIYFLVMMPRPSYFPRF
jgi:hypothetical protein